MPKARMTIFPGVFFCLLLGKVILISGCGGSETAQAVQSEDAGRFKNLQKLGQANTRETIAEYKKKGIAESKNRAKSTSGLSKD